MKTQGLIVSALVTTLLITGCVTTTSVAEQEQQAQHRNEQFLLAQTAIAALTQRVEQAKAERLFYFSPDPYKDALSEYDDANDEFQDVSFDPAQATVDQTSKVLAYTKKANQALDTAWQVTKISKMTLADSFEQLERIKVLGVPKLYSKEYGRAREKLDDLVEYIADGDIAKAQDRQATLLTTLSALEIKAVKEIKLSKLNSGINNLIKARAARIVPISFQKAIASKESAEAVIAASPRDSESISSAVNLATFDLKHAEHLMLAVKNLRVIKDKDLESYILENENQLAKISMALGLADARNLAISAQRELVRNKASETVTLINELQLKNTKLQQTIEEKNNLLTTAADDKDKLNSEMINQLMNKDQQLATLNQQLEQVAIKEKMLTQSLLAVNQELTLLKTTVELETAKRSAQESTNKLIAQKTQLEHDNNALKINSQVSRLQIELSSVNDKNLSLNAENKSLQDELSTLRKALQVKG